MHQLFASNKILERFFFLFTILLYSNTKHNIFSLRFAMLLVEEINNDTLLDVTIPVNKSIAADLKRSMEDCLNSHKTGIESLVSYEQF